METILATHESFQDKGHAKHFDARYRLNLRGLKKEYESFNEFQLLCKYKSHINGKNFLDFGCATGEMYRYLQHYHSDLKYFGLDISIPAIQRAKDKYPMGNFIVISEDIKISKQVEKLKFRPDILFSRDVVLHQAQPFEFLKELVGISNSALILRLRTRDKGKTVLDPELSAQYYCGKWAPYMILNIHELIDVIRSCTNIDTLHILKNYVVLGGCHGRYLDKECFYSETGTAETAVFLKKSELAVVNPRIEISHNEEKAIYSGILNKKPYYALKALQQRILPQ